MEIIEKTIGQLKEFAEKIVMPSDDISYYRIIFPAASKADYYFEAYIYDDGEPQIAAERIDSDEDEAFWYYPLESPDYESTEAQHKTFIERTLLLLKHPSRIIQTKGLLFGGFICEFFNDNEWHRMYGHSCFKFGVKLPKIKGNKHIYVSDAIYE